MTASVRLPRRRKEGSAGAWVTGWGEGRWAPPVRLGRASARHGDLASAGDRRIAAWDETSEEGSIFAALSSGGGARDPALRLSARAGDSHPLAVATTDGFLVVWTTQVDGAAGWASARVPMPTSPAGPAS